MRLITTLAEFALSCSSLHAFNREFVTTTTRAIGAAGGVAIAWGQGGTTDAVSNITDANAFSRSLALGSAEFSDEEVGRVLASGAITPEAAFTPQRRDALQFFRESDTQWGPSVVFRLWLSQGGLMFFAFAPQTRASARRMVSRAVPALDAAFPVVALAHKLFRNAADSDEAATLPRSLSLELKLTAAEHETMSLVLRGLTNPEIASVLGVSLNTVRNRLASCFKKLNVSTRTEAAFVVTQSRAENRVQTGPALADYNRLAKQMRISISLAHQKQSTRAH